MKAKRVKKIQRRLFDHKKELAVSHDVLSNLIKEARETMRILDIASKEIDGAIKRLDKRASKLT